MISQTTFRRIRQARALTTAVFCSALVLLAELAMEIKPHRAGYWELFKWRMEKVVGFQSIMFYRFGQATGGLKGGTMNDVKLQVARKLNPTSGTICVP